MHAPKQRICDRIADEEDLESGKIISEMLGADKGDAPEKRGEGAEGVTAQMRALQKAGFHKGFAFVVAAKAPLDFSFIVS